MSQVPTSKIVKRIALVVAVTAFALLLGEGLVRGLGRYRMSFPYIEDWDGIMAGRPGAHGRHRLDDIFDAYVSFNRQRFRGSAETRLEPTPGALRIATLGDGFTMGWGVNDDQTYPARLQVLLQQELGRPVEVLNAGVEGTGTGEQALYYQRWVGRFHPDIVVLGVNSTDPYDDRSRGLFSVGADGVAIPRSPEARNQSHRRFRSVVHSIPGFDFLDKNSRLFGYVRHLLWQAWYREQWMKSEELDKALPLTAAEIRWLDGEVRKSGGRLFVIYIPQNQWATYPPRERLTEERLAGLLQDLSGQEHAPFSDLSPAIRAASARSPQPLYYLRHDCYPTSQGNAVLAQLVAELVRNQLGPPAHAPASGQ